MRKFRGFDEAVIVDVETTGLDEGKDRIVSVAMIRTSFGILKCDSEGLEIDPVFSLVNPKRNIPARTSVVHGIYGRDVRDAPPFSDLAEQLRDFVGGRPVIAHNLPFDKRFLDAEFRRAGVKPLLRNKKYCTMQRFRDFNHGIQKGSRLEDAAKALRLEGRSGNIHDAAEDAMLALRIAKVFFMMDNGIEIPGGAPKPPRRRGGFVSRRSRWW